jgi:hypothetical protein
MAYTRFTLDRSTPSLWLAQFTDHHGVDQIDRYLAIQYRTTSAYD